MKVITGIQPVNLGPQIGDVYEDEEHVYILTEVIRPDASAPRQAIALVLRKDNKTGDEVATYRSPTHADVDLANMTPCPDAQVVLWPSLKA